MLLPASNSGAKRTRRSGHVPEVQRTHALASFARKNAVGTGAGPRMIFGFNAGSGSKKITFLMPEMEQKDGARFVSNGEPRRLRKTVCTQQLLSGEEWRVAFEQSGLAGMNTVAKRKSRAQK